MSSSPELYVCIYVIQKYMIVFAMVGVIGVSALIIGRKWTSLCG